QRLPLRRDVTVRRTNQMSWIPKWIGHSAKKIPVDEKQNDAPTMKMMPMMRMRMNQMMTTNRTSARENRSRNAAALRKSNPIRPSRPPLPVI
ncbi:MAG TPA: hypothetical protein VKU82_13230, partial [Planctomycetaceae bacterium]|nr:hypothetical protein [Planctomycetaceae bacterium]